MGFSSMSSDRSNVFFRFLVLHESDGFSSGFINLFCEFGWLARNCLRKMGFHRNIAQMSGNENNIFEHQNNIIIYRGVILQLALPRESPSLGN